VKTECTTLALKNTMYTDLHQKLGHPYKQAVIDTAKYYGIQLNKATIEPVCANCAIRKIRVNNFGHNDGNQVTTKGDGISIDISSTNQISYGGSKFCYSYNINTQVTLELLPVSQIRAFRHSD
jgi:hypothetical protein